MGRNVKLFLWSDGWYIENNKAWFISGIGNILFCLDIQTKECEYVAQIPKESGKFRVNPRCVKCGNDIFCMPDKGSSIWIYNVKSGNFTEIKIRNTNNVRLEFDAVWKYENLIFGVSYGLRQIIKFDVNQKKIIDYYEIDSKGYITDSLKIKNEIYILYGNGKVYQFDMETGKMRFYPLPNIERKFNAFCYDGEKFWIGGYHKELYVWNKKKNVISIKDNFPKEFGKYSFTKDTDGKIDYITDEYDEPAFQYIIMVEKSIWFIPKQTNKIIYVNKDNQELHLFEIAEEQESRKSLLKNECGMKYILEYVVDERYIGLFSLKNKCILEIDTRKLKYWWCDYCFSDYCLKRLVGIYGNMFREGCIFQREIYCKAFHLDSDYLDDKKRDVGTEIYQRVAYED